MHDDKPGWTTAVSSAAEPLLKEAAAVAGITFDMARELMPDVVSITNLCALLNLHNSRAVKVSVPSALRHARAAAGKRPLYDYHILEVDGEIWSSPFTAAGEAPGVRSHLRRGHIRRLPTGRNTWVRAAYVHGSVAGFVDKDYRVTA